MSDGCTSALQHTGKGKQTCLTHKEKMLFGRQTNKELENRTFKCQLPKQNYQISTRRFTSPFDILSIDYTKKNEHTI